MYKHPPCPPRKPKFKVFNYEHQNRSSRSGSPAFGNHLKFTARKFFEPVWCKEAAVIVRVLVKRVTERRDQMEIAAFCQHAAQFEHHPIRMPYMFQNGIALDVLQSEGTANVLRPQLRPPPAAQTGLC